MHTTLREVSTINTLKMQLCSVAQSCLTLCDSMDCSRPGKKKKISLVLSFYSVLWCSLALFSLLFIFEYWSSLKNRLTETCFLKNHWPVCYCPCFAADSGHDGWRSVVLKESAPVREGRRQRQAGFHGMKRPSSQTAPTFPAQLPVSLWSRWRGALHLGWAEPLPLSLFQE